MTDYDWINPSHYKMDGRKECIEEIEDLYGYDYAKAFCFCTVHRYLYRKGRKPDNELKQDASKARWYLDRITLYDRNELSEMTKDERRIFDGYAKEVREVLMR